MLTRLRENLKEIDNNDDGLETIEMVVLAAAILALAFLFIKFVLPWLNSFVNSTSKSLEDSNTCITNPEDESCRATSKP